MNISSNEIKKRDFKKVLRGYDANEVEAFLETVSSHYEKLVSENRSLIEQVNSLNADVEVYKENEQTLQKAIVKAQDLADEIVQNAKKKSEIIIKEAELGAQEYKQNLEKELIERKQELEELKSRNDRLVDDVKNFIQDKLYEFDEFVKRKKILKMELSKKFDTDEEQIEESETNIKSLPKHELKQDYSSPQSPFDENFEVK